MKKKVVLLGTIVVILIGLGLVYYLWTESQPKEYGKDCVKIYEGPLVGLIENEEGTVVVVRDLDTEELSYILFTDKDLDTKFEREPEVERIIRQKEYGTYLGVCTEYSSVLEGEGAYENGYPLAIAWIYVGHSSEQEPETSYVIPEFQIELPNGSEMIGKIGSGENWVIEHENYLAVKEFPYEGRYDLWTQAGWITLLPGEYSGKETGKPQTSWNHCEWSNYQKIENGYICEVSLDAYNVLDIYDQNIPEDKQTAECWVLVFEDPKGMQETGIHSNWIFLSKKCFTKEEALGIAKTYVPAYTE